MLNKVLVGTGIFAAGVIVGLKISEYITEKTIDEKVKNAFEKAMNENKPDDTANDIPEENTNEEPEETEDSTEEATPSDERKSGKLKSGFKRVINNIKAYWTEPVQDQQEQYEDLVKQYAPEDYMSDDYDLTGTKWTEDSPRGYFFRDQKPEEGNMVGNEIKKAEEDFKASKVHPGVNEDIFVQDGPSQEPEIINPAESDLDSSLIPCWLVFPGGEVADEDSGNEIVYARDILGDEIMDEMLYNDDAMATGLYVYIPHYQMTVYLFYYDTKPYRKWLEDHPELRR